MDGLSLSFLSRVPIILEPTVYGNTAEHSVSQWNHVETIAHTDHNARRPSQLSSPW